MAKTTELNKNELENKMQLYANELFLYISSFYVKLFWYFICQICR